MALAAAGAGFGATPEMHRAKLEPLVAACKDVLELKHPTTEDMTARVEALEKGVAAVIWCRFPIYDVPWLLEQGRCSYWSGLDMKAEFQLIDAIRARLKPAAPWLPPPQARRKYVAEEAVCRLMLAPTIVACRQLLATPNVDDATFAAHIQQLEHGVAAFLMRVAPEVHKAVPEKQLCIHLRNCNSKHASGHYMTAELELLEKMNAEHQSRSACKNLQFSEVALKALLGNPSATKAELERCGLLYEDCLSSHVRSAYKAQTAKCLETGDFKSHTKEELVEMAKYFDVAPQSVFLVLIRDKKQLLTHLALVDKFRARLAELSAPAPAAASTQT